MNTLVQLAIPVRRFQSSFELDRQLEAAAYGLEAEHDSAYRAARQQYLRQLLSDPNQPKHVKGWIRQELNRLQRIEFAQQSGYRAVGSSAINIHKLAKAGMRNLGPGGSARDLRGIPGLDVGHKLGLHNQHHPANFRLEDARFNRARPGISRRLGLFDRYREGEVSFEAELEKISVNLELEDPESFFTKVTPIPGIGNKEGHEILTRLALRGLPLNLAEKSAVEMGVIRPDRGGRSYWNFPRAVAESFKATAQPAHSLRPTPSSSVPVALRLIRQRFISLYRRAMHAKTRIAALEWVGEALHLLQDSFSSAHVERIGGTGRIRHIRAFYIRLNWPPLSRAPHEHNAPSDSRDDIYLHGVLRPEARAAIRASREFLVMVLRHLGVPRSPRNNAELITFTHRYLS